MRKILVGIFSALALITLMSRSQAKAAIPPDLPASYLPHLPGDINGNGQVNGVDIVYGVNYLKGTGNPPPHVATTCFGTSSFYIDADVNGNGAFNGIDITYFVRYLKGQISILLYYTGCYRDSVQITDASILPGQNVTFYSDTTYILNGFVFVDSGAVLTIQPGCVIKGHPGQGANASALLVARFGKIIADGTVDAPIVMTGSVDWSDSMGAVPVDLEGSWGGLLILGCASTNNPGNLKNIEGIPETEPRGAYGNGANPPIDDDSSGVLRYISVRHGGSIIGANNEINGISLGAVGSKTVLDYIEVFGNLDDGIEFFGGNAHIKHAISVFNDDDNIDTDEGYHGRIQFYMALQNPALLRGNRGGEWDGGVDVEDAQPYSNPHLANITFIGSGADSNNTDNDWGVMWRDYAMGSFYNSIITEYKKRGIDFGDGTSGPPTKYNFIPNPDPLSPYQNADSMKVHYTLWSHFGLAPDGNRYDMFRADNLVDTAVADHMMDPNFHNQILLAPVLNSISWGRDHNLDPRYNGSAGLNPGNAYPDDPWFSDAPYYGAFNPDTNAPLWTDGWTYLSKLGFTQH